MTEASSSGSGSGRRIGVRDPDFPAYWTITEAVAILGIPQTPRQFRARVQARGIRPAGTRHSGSWRGRPAAAYPAEELIRLAGDIPDA